MLLPVRQKLSRTLVLRQSTGATLRCPLVTLMCQETPTSCPLYRRCRVTMTRRRLPVGYLKVLRKTRMRLAWQHQFFLLQDLILCQVGRVSVTALIKTFRLSRLPMLPGSRVASLVRRSISFAPTNLRWIWPAHQRHDVLKQVVPPRLPASPLSTDKLQTHLALLVLLSLPRVARCG